MVVVEADEGGAKASQHRHLRRSLFRSIGGIQLFELHSTNGGKAVKFITKPPSWKLPKGPSEATAQVPKPKRKKNKKGKKAARKAVPAQTTAGTSSTLMSSSVRAKMAEIEDIDKNYELNILPAQPKYYNKEYVKPVNFFFKTPAKENCGVGGLDSAPTKVPLVSTPALYGNVDDQRRAPLYIANASYIERSPDGMAIGGVQAECSPAIEAAYCNPHDNVENRRPAPFDVAGASYIEGSPEGVTEIQSECSPAFKSAFSSDLFDNVEDQVQAPFDVVNGSNIEQSPEGTDLAKGEIHLEYSPDIESESCSLHDNVEDQPNGSNFGKSPEGTDLAKGDIQSEYSPDIESASCSLHEKVEEQPQEPLDISNASIDRSLEGNELLGESEIQLESIPSTESVCSSDAQKSRENSGLQSCIHIDNSRRVSKVLSFQRGYSDDTGKPLQAPPSVQVLRLRSGRTINRSTRVGQNAEKPDQSGKVLRFVDSDKSDQMVVDSDKSDQLVADIDKSDQLVIDVDESDQLVVDSGKSDQLVVDSGKSDQLVIDVDKSDQLVVDSGKSDQRQGRMVAVLDDAGNRPGVESDEDQESHPDEDSNENQQDAASVAEESHPDEESDEDQEEAVDGDSSESQLVPIIGADAVYKACRQAGPLHWEDAFSTQMIDKCQKIGEGCFGEVFRAIDDDGAEVALKVIPIEGDFKVNGEGQKSFAEILPEILISVAMSKLKNNAEYATPNFVEVKRVVCVEGMYPARLAQAWEEYDVEKGSENDPPTFPNQQIFIVFVFANGGCDLEHAKLNSYKQANSIVRQIAVTLAIAEIDLEFEHRDLHIGNVLIKQTKNTEIEYVFDGKRISIQSHGVHVFIIDFTNSRSCQGKQELWQQIFAYAPEDIVYTNLAYDSALFRGEGDFQFDIYRMMRDLNGNEWKSFYPKTNVFWIHYLIDKLINFKKYAGNRRITAKQAAPLTDLCQGIERFTSCQEMILNHEFFQGLVS